MGKQWGYIQLAFLHCVATCDCWQEHRATQQQRRTRGRAEQWVVAHLRHNCCHSTWFGLGEITPFPLCCPQPFCILRGECSKQVVFKCCTVWESYAHPCHFSQDKVGQLAPRESILQALPVHDATQTCNVVYSVTGTPYFKQLGFGAHSDSATCAGGVSCTYIESRLME